MSSTEHIDRDVEAMRLELAATLAELRDCLASRKRAISFPATLPFSPWALIAFPILAIGAAIAWALKAGAFKKKAGTTYAVKPAKPSRLSHEVVASLSAVLGFLTSGTVGRIVEAALQSTLLESAARGIENSKSATDTARAQPSLQSLVMPRRGWKEIALNIYNHISTHRVLAIAAGVTFYSLLAVFPAIAALVSLYGLFADAGTISGHLDDLSGVLPGGAIDVVRDQLTRVVAQGQGTLGLTFGISLLTSIWSANAGMKAFFDALNIIYGEDEKRSFIKLNALSLAFTTCAILFLLFALGAIVVLPVALNYVGVEDKANDLLPLLRWPAMFAVIAFALAVLYRFGPSHGQARWRWISWGSAAASLAWLGASILFSWYTAHFSSYNATYGSLGAVIGFMIWIWLSVIVFLMGAELDAELEGGPVQAQSLPLPARRAGIAASA